MGLNDSNSPNETSGEFVADSELAEEIEKRSTPSTPLNGGVLFRQGEDANALYYVKSGEIALWAESGNRMVMCFRIGAGSLAGLPAIVGNKPYSLTAAPSAGAQILKLDRTEFLRLLADKPILATKVLQLLAAQIRLARHSYLELLS